MSSFHGLIPRPLTLLPLGGATGHETAHFRGCNVAQLSAQEEELTGLQQWWLVSRTLCAGHPETTWRRRRGGARRCHGKTQPVADHNPTWMQCHVCIQRV